MPAWVCKRVTKPSFNITEAGHQYLNHTFYYPGRLEWSPIDLTIVDPIDPDMSALFLQFVKKSGYALPEDVNAATNHVLTKNGFRAAIGGQFSIRQITNGNKTVEKWTLVNPWITEVNYGELSYDSDELVQISVKIRYDYAKMDLTVAQGLPPGLKNLG